MSRVFTDSEIAVYAFVLENPGCTIEEIEAGVHYNGSTVRRAVIDLESIGSVRRWRKRSSPNRGRGRLPYLYRALRGTEPIELYREEASERHRKRQITKRKAPYQRGLRRRRGDGQMMTKQEWEIVVVNFELLHPDRGWTIIDEHVTMRRKAGEKPDLTMDDYERLRRKAERMRR